VAEKRKKVWIDRLQTLLSIRLALYFIIYQFTVWLLFAVAYGTSAARERMLGPAAGASSFVLTAAPAALLGVLFIWDAVRMLHRVVGPLVRVRQAIRAVTAGEELTLVSLREGDHLQELKDDLNEMLRALEQRGAVVLKPSAASRAEKPTVAV
jgi:nitrogen fixation/metabolism regulation signal transduction histidine kinase